MQKSLSKFLIGTVLSTVLLSTTVFAESVKYTMFNEEANKSYEYEFYVSDVNRVEKNQTMLLDYFNAYNLKVDKYYVPEGAVFQVKYPKNVAKEGENDGTYVTKVWSQEGENFYNGNGTPFGEEPNVNASGYLETTEMAKFTVNFNPQTNSGDASSVLIADLSKSGNQKAYLFEIDKSLPPVNRTNYKFDFTKTGTTTTPATTNKTTTTPATTKSSVYFNGTDTKLQAVVKNGTSYLPVRALIQNVLGGTVDYNAKTGAVTANVNGKTTTYEASKTVTINGSTYLPVRAFSEDLGYKVGWDAKTQTVTIKK